MSPRTHQKMQGNLDMTRSEYDLIISSKVNFILVFVYNQRVQ